MKSIWREKTSRKWTFCVQKITVSLFFGRLSPSNFFLSNLEDGFHCPNDSFQSAAWSQRIISLFICFVSSISTVGQFSTDFHSESRRSVCHASRDFGREEQVFIFYGTRTCAEQLIHNGFVDVNNSHDALTLRIGLSKSDSLADQRTAVMRKLGILSGLKCLPFISSTSFA